MFYALLKKYNLTLVEAGTRIFKNLYLVRTSDLEWLLNEDCIGKKEKLHAAMFTCGSLNDIENWIYDKDYHNRYSSLCILLKASSCINMTINNK